MELKLPILDIIRGTTVDGPGFRTAIYIAGCDHHCPGCHNPASWDPQEGKLMTIDELLEIVKEEDFNVTLTGGDPLFHPVETMELAKAVSNLGYKVWLYTGFEYAEILSSPTLAAVLPYVEAIVDGPFIESMKDPDLPFRGSSNQKIIFPNQ